MYRERSRTLPQQGSKTPWRLHQNYVKDLHASLHPLDDGTMEFKAAPRARKVGEWANAESVR
jgi:monooxygenase